MTEYIKSPLGASLDVLASQRARDAVFRAGRSLPCTVAAVVSPGIVTVNFQVNAQPFTLPQVTVPVAMPPYITYPIAVGDKGVVFSADVRLGGLTGLGSGVPDLTQPGNLSALVFFWLGNTVQTTLDPNSVVVEGNLIVNATMLGFFGHAATTEKTVAGALSAVTDPNAKAVLLSLITALAAYGLVINGTT